MNLEDLPQMPDEMRKEFERRLSGTYYPPTHNGLIAAVQAVCPGVAGIREVQKPVSLPWYKRLWLKLRGKDVPTFTAVEMAVILLPGSYGSAKVREAVQEQVDEHRPAGVLVSVDFYKGGL